ncbi:hypothetical protein D3C81_1925190 [compost metagenome]
MQPGKLLIFHTALAQLLGKGLYLAAAGEQTQIAQRLLDQHIECLAILIVGGDNHKVGRINIHLVDGRREGLAMNQSGAHWK